MPLSGATRRMKNCSADPPFGSAAFRGQTKEMPQSQRAILRYKNPIFRGCMRARDLLSLVVFLLYVNPSPGAAQTAGFVNPCRKGYEALQRREFHIAEAMLKDCMKVNPNQMYSYLALCGLYQSQGRVADLQQVASEGMRRFPEEKRFYLTVGNHAGESEQYEKAIEVFNEGYRRWPDDPSIKKNLANAQLLLGMKLLDKNDNAAAEPHLRQAAKLAENDVEAHLNLGRALHNLNQSVEAVSEFERILTIDPHTPLAHLHRGMVLSALGELDSAVADLGQEIKFNPDYPPSYLIRGQALMKRGDWTAAASDLDLAVQKMPENPKATYARALCLNYLGKTKDAEADFRKTIELDPSNPEPMNALGRLLWLSNLKKEAEDLFRKAREQSQAIRTVEPGEIKFRSAQPQK